VISESPRESCLSALPLEAQRSARSWNTEAPRGAVRAWSLHDPTNRQAAHFRQFDDCPTIRPEHRFGQHTGHCRAGTEPVVHSVCCWRMPATRTSDLDVYRTRTAHAKSPFGTFSRGIGTGPSCAVVMSRAVIERRVAAGEATALISKGVTALRTTKELFHVIVVVGMGVNHRGHLSRMLQHLELGPHLRICVGELGLLVRNVLFIGFVVGDARRLVRRLGASLLTAIEALA
jgi:hypothetical protein